MWLTLDMYRRLADPRRNAGRGGAYPADGLADTSASVEGCVHCHRVAGALPNATDMLGMTAALNSATYASPLIRPERAPTAVSSWLSRPSQLAAAENGASMSGKSPRPSRVVPCHVK